MQMENLLCLLESSVSDKASCPKTLAPQQSHIPPSKGMIVLLQRQRSVSLTHIGLQGTTAEEVEANDRRQAALKLDLVRPSS
jgi:hypothetical protein